MQKNKTMRCLMVLLLLAAKGIAQPMDYQKEKESIEILLNNDTLLDSLTDNALRNSYYIKSFEGELSQQYENVKQEKNKWLSTFRLGINFFSVNTTMNAQDQSVTTAGLLPNLGLSLGIDPEKFINRKSYIREAQYNIVRSENQLKHQRRQIRDEVLRLYYQYLEALGILELRDDANETQKEHCTVIEDKFKKGEARMEEVLLTQSAYVLTKEALLKTQLLVHKLKREIALFTSNTEKEMPAVTALKK